MIDGFIRVAAATPDLKVADPVYNRERIEDMIGQAEEKNVQVLVFPELSLTGYTCGDLFLQDALIRSAKEELAKLIKSTRGISMLIFVGLPWEVDGKLYNVAAAICDGTLLGVVPKRNIPNYSEYYELRHFNPGNDEPFIIEWDGSFVPFGSNILFSCENIPGLTVAAEICEDVWVMNPPSISHAKAGATLIVNCSASDETTAKNIYRDDLISGQSARLICGYVYADAGEGESTQDLVFAGHDIIAEDGNILAESERFKCGLIFADMDLERINNERRRMTTCHIEEPGEKYDVIGFTLDIPENDDVTLARYIDPAPFVPSDERARDARCEEILNIQATGLKKRLSHLGSPRVVIGISGGLDSTLALLVAARTLDMMDESRSNIYAVTMPCFGTTDRTYNNACTLASKIGAQLKEVNIRKAVTQHFEDIGHDMDVKDITFENSQARERTQILMDLANQTGGLVVGTGDMSELALGWATYNGDHMSMYAVNSSVPKTLVRHLVRYYADTCGDEELASTLYDILDTPVSPELLPAREGEIVQKTEDLVGPYELHDFFLYYVLRYGYMPSRIFKLAKAAFEGVYDADTIYKWLTTFYRRFFAQQYKRSCLPDGPKVGSVAVSPRGDLRMPSDAAVRIWLDDIDAIDPEKD